MREKKRRKKNGSLDKKAIPDPCLKFRVSATSEEKSSFHNILETVEAIFAAAAAGCTLQLISIRVPFPKD